MGRKIEMWDEDWIKGLKEKEKAIVDKPLKTEVSEYDNYDGCLPYIVLGTGIITGIIFGSMSGSDEIGFGAGSVASLTMLSIALFLNREQEKFK